MFAVSLIIQKYLICVAKLMLGDISGISRIYCVEAMRIEDLLCYIFGNEKLQCFCGDREELPVPPLWEREIQRSSLPRKLSWDCSQSSWTLKFQEYFFRHRYWRLAGNEKNWYVDVNVWKTTEKIQKMECLMLQHRHSIFIMRIMKHGISYSENL